MHLEPDPVAERVVEAVLEHLAGLLRAQRRVAVLLEDVARDLEQVGAGDYRLRRGDRAVEFLLAELVPLEQLVRRRADHEHAGHVGETARVAVAREEVEADRLAREDRARAPVCADAARSPLW